MRLSIWSARWLRPYPVAHTFGGRRRADPDREAPGQPPSCGCRRRASPTEGPAAPAGAVRGGAPGRRDARRGRHAGPARPGRRRGHRAHHVRGRGREAGRRRPAATTRRECALRRPRRSSGWPTCAVRGLPRPGPGHAPVHRADQGRGGRRRRATGRRSSTPITAATRTPTTRWCSRRCTPPVGPMTRLGLDGAALPDLRDPILDRSGAAGRRPTCSTRPHSSTSSRCGSPSSRRWPATRREMIGGRHPRSFSYIEALARMRGGHSGYLLAEAFVPVRERLSRPAGPTLDT